MSFSIAEHFTVLEHAADKCAAVSEAGYVLPAPLYFQDRADFWATVAAIALNTRDAIETSPVKFCSFSFLRYEDDIKEGCEDEPLLTLLLNIYLFHERNLEREDESGADSFLKKLLKNHNDFLSALYGIREQFLGTQAIAGLPEGYAAETQGLAQIDFTREMEECRFIPGVRGFAADLQLRTEVYING